MNHGIKVLITGDFYGGNRIENLILNESYDKIFNEFLPVIQDSNIAITNLESALTNSINSISKTGPAIKSHPKTIEALKNAGFNLVTLANNHIMDFGEPGLTDTLNLCKKNRINTVGAGLNANEAKSTFYIEINEKRLAFLNIAENEWSTTQGNEPGANALNPVTNFYAIQEAREKADFVFVIIHGGHETYNLPSPRMKETYRFFIDTGSDAVIGHHTHCYSGYEIYAGKPIFYSLGNFIFDSANKREPAWYEGFAVQFIIKSGEMTFKIIPYFQNRTKPGLELLNEEYNNKFNHKLEKLNEFIQDDAGLEISFKEHIKKVKKSYSAFLEPHSNKYLFALQNRKILPSLLSQRKRLFLQNLLRCEAHRDVILYILNQK